MKDLKFEQKRTLSRLEAADQLTALAAALREGGDAELDLGAGTLSLRIPDDLRSELEIEIGGGQIELEIELKWPTARPRTTPSRAPATPEKAPGRTKSPAKNADRAGAAASRTKTTKRSATKTP